MKCKTKNSGIPGMLTDTATIQAQHFLKTIFHHGEIIKIIITLIKVIQISKQNKYNQLYSNMSFSEPKHPLAWDVHSPPLQF